MSNIEVSREELQSASQRLIVNGLNIDSNQADEIIDQFEYAELTGKHTHGYARVPWLLNQVLNGHESLDFSGPSQPIVHVDCSESIGYLAAQEIASHIGDTSEAAPFKMVVAHNIFPTNTLGYYLRSMLENENQIGFIFGTTPSLVVGPGMDHKSIGTNPIAIGMLHDNTEVIADITTASTSLGELLQAKYWGGFNPEKFQTSNGETPSKIDELYEDGRFTGAIIQKTDTKAEGRLYALNLMTQLLTGLMTQQPSNRGNLIFGSVDTNFITGSDQALGVLSLFDQPHLLPGVESHKRYLAAKEKPTITLPESLLQDILSRP